MLESRTARSLTLFEELAFDLAAEGHDLVHRLRPGGAIALAHVLKFGVAGAGLK